MKNELDMGTYDVEVIKGISTKNRHEQNLELYAKIQQDLFNFPFNCHCTKSGSLIFLAKENIKLSKLNKIWVLI